MFAKLTVSIIAVGFAFSLSVCYAENATRDDCSYHKNLTFSNEVKNIDDVARGVVKGVFFIRLFDGLWPVPDRYQVYSYEKDGINLHSPYDILNILNANCPVKTVGFITFGRYDKSEYSVDDKSLPRDKVTIKHDGSFTIEIHNVSFSERKLNYVLIHNDTQYIKISDENPNLWRVMLSVFKAINLRK